MPAIKIILLIACAMQCGYAGRYRDASSYSSQLHGNYHVPSHHHHRFHSDHDRFNEHDDSRYENSHESYSFEYSSLTTTTTDYPTWFPTTSSYFFPKERIWEVLSKTTTTIPNVNDEINNEVHSDEAEKEIFTYDDKDRFGPSNWYLISRQCAGRFQSPVALNTKGALVDGNSQPLTIEGLDAKPTSMKIENNGHSMKISFVYPNNQKVRILGGPLEIPYILDSVHWHWGKVDKNGSEHTLNSRRFSAEMHLVAYNSNYDSFASASTEAKGLAVLGIFYELDNIRQHHNKWIKFTNQVIEPESSYTETKNVLTIRDIIEHDKFELLTYKGSLTTPNCTENVQWMLSSRPLSISSFELDELRKLKDERGIVINRNNRPLQRLNSRKIVIYV